MATPWQSQLSNFLWIKFGAEEWGGLIKKKKKKKKEREGKQAKPDLVQFPSHPRLRSLSALTPPLAGGGVPAVYQAVGGGQDTRRTQAAV